MANDTKMMCPFRRKENGDFEPCYGKGCMAYFEQKSYTFGNLNSNCTATETTKFGCRLITSRFDTPKYHNVSNISQGRRELE